MSTILRQVRSIQPRAGLSINRTESYIENKGMLPDGSVFLFLIGSPLDPKTDVYKRVINAAEFGVVSSDRPTALSRNEPYYRSSSYTQELPDVQDAINGAAYTREKVNELTKNWDLLEKSFLTSGTTYSYPIIDEGVLTPLLMQYTEIQDQLVQLTADVAEQTAVCSSLTAAAVVATTQRDFARNTFASATTTLALATAIRTNPAVDAAATVGDKAALDSNITDLGALRVAASAQLVEADAALVRANEEIETCAATLASISATKRSVELAGASILAQIKLLCPSYAI